MYIYMHVRMYVHTYISKYLISSHSLYGVWEYIDEFIDRLGPMLIHLVICYTYLFYSYRWIIRTLFSSCERFAYLLRIYARVYTYSRMLYDMIMI